jgi:hypothetical protein
LPHIAFDLETTLSPDKVLDLYTDFSPRRSERWPGLDSKLFEVYATGPNSADVREGGPPQFWAKEKYDWSEPGKVRWEVYESNFCKPGSYVQAVISPSGSGSRVHIDWERTASSIMGSVAFLVLQLTGGSAIKSSFGKGLRKAETAT